MVQALSRRDGLAASGAVRSRSRSPAAGGDADARLAAIDDGVYKVVEDLNEFRFFWAERHETTASVEWLKNSRFPKHVLEKRGMIFRIKQKKVSEEFAEGMRQARTKEWGKFLRAKAVEVISQEKATALMNDGAECIPLRWIDTDKSEHLRRQGGPEVKPLHKARIVARRDLEK